MSGKTYEGNVHLLGFAFFCWENFLGLYKISLFRECHSTYSELVIKMNVFIQSIYILELYA